MATAQHKGLFSNMTVARRLYFLILIPLILLFLSGIISITALNTDLQTFKRIDKEVISIQTGNQFIRRLLRRYLLVLHDVNIGSTTSSEGIEKLQWLEKDLAHAKENGSEWIIVNIHIGPYTVGDHAGDLKLAGEKGERLRLGAVLEQYGVNLVIEGHDHIPCVTYGIVQGQKVDGGVVYMDTGAAGPKAYDLTKVMPDSYFDLFQFLDRTGRKNNIYQDFADIQVKKDKIHVVMYERNTVKKGQPLKIVDQFDVVK